MTGLFGERRPWDEDGQKLLADVSDYLGTFVVFPSVHAHVATTLWAVHCHLIDRFESTPRLALLSPEPGSGKSRCLEALELIVPAPLFAFNASTAALFRMIDKARPTLLLDEADAIFGKYGKDDGSEDLRGLLNAGHRRGAQIPRCVGPTFAVQLFPVFAAVALAGLGDLPETVMSRSVVVRMRRRAPSETVRPFRYREAATDGLALRERLAAWASELPDHLPLPVLPSGVTDRPGDLWEPLVQVADVAGGDWPDLARTAAVEFCKADTGREASLGVRLLTDLRDIFGSDDVLPTEVAIERLVGLEESPWGDLRGHQLDARRLARYLRNYEIQPTQLRFEGEKRRGYRREDLHEAWSRYLPPSLTPSEAVQAVHPVQRRSEHTTAVPGSEPDPVHGTDPVQNTPPLTSGVPHVPHVPLSQGSGPTDPGTDETGLDSEPLYLPDDPARFTR